MQSTKIFEHLKVNVRLRTFHKHNENISKLNIYLVYV